MGVEGPEGEEVELFGGAGEVLGVEIYDLGDEGLVGVHKSPKSCWLLAGMSSLFMQEARVCTFPHPSQRARRMGHPGVMGPGARPAQPESNA